MGTAEVKSRYELILLKWWSLPNLLSVEALMSRRRSACCTSGVFLMALRKFLYSRNALIPANLAIGLSSMRLRFIESPVISVYYSFYFCDILMLAHPSVAMQGQASRLLYLFHRWVLLQGIFGRRRRFWRRIPLAWCLQIDYALPPGRSRDISVRQQHYREAVYAPSGYNCLSNRGWTLSVGGAYSLVPCLLRGIVSKVLAGRISSCTIRGIANMPPGGFHR